MRFSTTAYGMSYKVTNNYTEDSLYFFNIEDAKEYITEMSTDTFWSEDDFTLYRFNPMSWAFVEQR